MIQVIPQAIETSQLTMMRQQILSHPFVDHSTLKGSFQGTRGFAIAFTREGLVELQERFPFFMPFLSLILPHFRPWYQKLFLPDLNAFYLNLLLVPSGASVGRHVDATLCSYVGVEGLRPKEVSVLYLQIPKGMKGGELSLFRGRDLVQKIVPQEGVLLHFAGNLGHSVDKVEGKGVRASLVCEKYRLSRAHLKKLSPLQVQSKAEFQAFLEEADKRIEDEAE